VPLAFVLFREWLLGRIPEWDLSHVPVKLVHREMRIIKIRLILEAYKEKRMRRKVSQSIWPSDAGILEEYWDCEPAYYNLEMTFPLADRRIIEFMHSVPLEHLYARGEERGLIRLAMQGILPDKILKRTTKGAYSPGYATILKADMHILTSLLKNAESPLSHELSGIIDFKKLHKSLEDLVNKKNLSYFTVEDWISLRVGFWCLFENWVINKKYRGEYSKKTLE
jgi:asparagine synthase (glutamine-hydrolysing)